MSITSLEYVKRRIGVEGNDSDDLLLGAMAAATEIVERETNRRYSHEICSFVVSGSVTTFQVAGHGLETGDKVRITRSDATAGDQTVTRVDEHHFSVPVAGDNAEIGGTIRKHLTTDRFSRGGDVVFISLRPVAEVIEVKESSKPGVFTTALLATDYYLHIDDSGVSFSGGLYRVDAKWPTKQIGGLYGRNMGLPGTVRITYVAGTARTPSDIVEATASLCSAVVDAAGQTPMASESLDYYSYSRQAIAELKEIPESAVSAMARRKLPII